MEFDEVTKTVMFNHHERSLTTGRLPEKVSLSEALHLFGVACDQKSQAGVDAYACLDNILSGDAIERPSQVYLRAMQLDILTHDLIRIIRAQCLLEVSAG